MNINTKFYKGMNLGGWLSQCDYINEHIDSFILENDIKLISSWGFDHVRIPIDYNILENEDGSYKQDGFDRIKKAITWCHTYNLNTIIDLHKTLGYCFDKFQNESGLFENEQLQERFYLLWEEIAKQFGHLHDTTAFELLNEVDDEKYIDKWNEIAEICISRIRKYAPDTIILYGSHHKNSANALKDLKKPYDDKVIYNFHFYEPLKYTHQGAYWTDEIDPNERISYEESGCSIEYFENMLASAIETAKKNNTSLYCGEYGIIDRVPTADALKWHRDLHAVFEKYGIARCIWNYKSLDFGISEERYDADRQELLKYV